MERDQNSVTSSVSLLGHKSDRPLIKQIPSHFLSLFLALPRELTNLLFYLFQALRNPPVTLLVCLWPFKSLCHQCKSQTRVHRVCGSYHVWDIQRHLPSCAAEHADCHDEQLLPAYCREYLCFTGGLLHCRSGHIGPRAHWKLNEAVCLR